MFVFGGFAEDALLHGSVTRPHGDVDILADRTTLDQHLRDADTIGFTEFEVLFEPKEGCPLVMAASAAEVNLEITVYDRTDEGGVFCWMTDADGRPVQIHLSPSTFEYPESTIDGVDVRTVSPLALYQIRAGVTAAGRVRAAPAEGRRGARDASRPILPARRSPDPAAPDHPGLTAPARTYTKTFLRHGHGRRGP